MDLPDSPFNGYSTVTVTSIDTRGALKFEPVRSAGPTAPVLRPAG